MFAEPASLSELYTCVMQIYDNGYPGSSDSDHQVINFRNVILKSSLLNSSGLKVWFFNSASIFKKMDEIRAIFDGVDFDIIDVTESWLKPYH